MKNSTPIVLDRLAAALQKHGVRLKRMQLLQTAATAFGHRNTHEMAASDDAGEMAPPAARHLLTAGVPGVGDMAFLQDADGNVFAVPPSRIASEPGRAGDWLVSPFGGLVDVTALRAKGQPVQPEASAAGAPASLGPDRCGAVGEEAIRHLAIRSQLNRAIYRVVRNHVMGNMTDADDHWSPYPLVDLMSNPAPSDIGTGEMEMVSLVDDIESAVRELLGLPREPDGAPAATETFLGRPVPRFTNGCSEIVVPRDGEPDISGHHRAGGDDQPPIDPEQPAYMTNQGCEVASVTQADLEALGLPFGQFDGGFYPLTPEEEQYIAEDVIDAADGLHEALIGYSVLYRGAKCLMPTMEIANHHESDSPLEDFPPRDKVMADATAYADRIRPRLEAMGGNVLVDDGMDDRVLVMLIVPFEAAMAVGDKEAWWRHLAWLMVDPDLPTVLRDEFRYTGDRFRASVSWIGEGEDGDYDPDVPGDRPLLRIDADRLVDGRWEEIDAGSYCTQVPAWSQPSIARALARHVVETLEDEGGSPKRTLERLSWIDAATVEAARQQQFVVDAMGADGYVAHETYGNPDRGTSVDLRRRADGSVRCEVYIDLTSAAVLEARGMDEVRAWLKTLPSDQEDPGDGSRTAHALAPQWDAPDPESVRWMLVDGNEAESDWFEPGEAYPFERRFIRIDDMKV